MLYPMYEIWKIHLASQSWRPHHKRVEMTTTVQSDTAPDWRQLFGVTGTGKKNTEPHGELSGRPAGGVDESTPQNRAVGERGIGSDGYKPRVTLSSHQEPTYFLGGSNGNAIIEEVMNDLGWKRVKEKTGEVYTMKWCEIKGTINYNTFKEGEQMVNHMPNCNLLTNKLGLLNSLQEFDRVTASMKKKAPKLDFIPETFRLEEYREREVWKDIWKEGDVWICKPTGRNQGKGIFLVKNREEFEQLCQEAEEKSHQNQQGKIPKAMNRVIQRYLDKPLLLNNKKFDIRAYMLIANCTPYIVLYHKGYIRLSLFEYENKFDNLAVHLTNQFIQKKDPMYKDMKEDTVWDMDKFNAHVNDNMAEDKGLEKDWVNNVLPARMKHIMTYCFNAVKHKLHCKTGYFELYGFDFMIDDAMKVWLIEVNVNPTLATNCESLKSVLPPMVKETLYLAVECFDKSRKNRSLMPLQSLEKFEIIYNGSTIRPSKHHAASPARLEGAASHHRSQSSSPLRRSRSLSPSKDTMVQYSGDNRRNYTSGRPGIKPPPTNALQSAPKQSLGTGITNGYVATRTSVQAGQATNKGNMLTSQLASRSSVQTTRNNNVQQQPQKSPYILQKVSGYGANTRTFNFERSQHALQPTKYTARTANGKTEAVRGSPQKVGPEQAKVHTEQRLSQKQLMCEVEVPGENNAEPIKGLLSESSPKGIHSTDKELTPTEAISVQPVQAETESKVSRGQKASTDPASKPTKEQTVPEKGPYLKLISKTSSKPGQGTSQKNDVPSNSKSPYIKPAGTRPTVQGKTTATKNIPIDKQLQKPVSHSKLENSSNNNNAVTVNILKDHKSNISRKGVALKMTHGSDEGDKKPGQATLRGS